MKPDSALRALAEPNRRAILELVRDGPRSAGEIAAHFDITAQAVSQHLRVLREAGLLSEERQGTRRLFVVRPEGFEPVRDFVAQFGTSQRSHRKGQAEKSHGQKLPGTKATRAKATSTGASPKRAKTPKLAAKPRGKRPSPTRGANPRGRARGSGRDGSRDG